MNFIARLLSLVAFGPFWLFVSVLRHISKSRRTLLRTVIGLPVLILALVMLGGLVFYNRLIVINLPEGFWQYLIVGTLALFILGLILEMPPIQKLLGVIERWLYRSMLELPPADTAKPQEAVDSEEEDPLVIVVASIATKGVTQGVSVKEAVKQIPQSMQDLLLRDIR